MDIYNMINNITMKYTMFITILLILFSCQQNNSRIDSTKTEKEADKTINNEVISNKDTKIQIREKLKKGAELDNQEFGELILYDDYFKDNITKYFVKRKNAEGREITAVVYNDRLRYMKTLILHSDDMSTENIEEYIAKINKNVDLAITNGYYTIVDNHYLKFRENDEIWYNVFILTISKKTGKQNFWNLISPENDYDYLKFMVEPFFNVEGFETRFLVSR